MNVATPSAHPCPCPMPHRWVAPPVAAARNCAPPPLRWADRPSWTFSKATPTPAAAACLHPKSNRLDLNGAHLHTELRTFASAAHNYYAALTIGSTQTEKIWKLSNKNWFFMILFANYTRWMGLDKFNWVINVIIQGIWKKIAPWNFQTEIRKFCDFSFVVLLIAVTAIFIIINYFDLYTWLNGSHNFHIYINLMCRIRTKTFFFYSVVKKQCIYFLPNLLH